MRAHLNTGPPEVMVCSFRISDLMGPDKPHGDPAATARWQLCPEAGGSILVPGRPFRLKQGTSRQMAKGSLSQHSEAGCSPGHGSSTLGELKSKWTWAEAMSRGLGTWVQSGPLFSPQVHRVTRAQTLVSTAAKDGAGMQCGLASTDSKAGCLFSSSDIC